MLLQEIVDTGTCSSKSSKLTVWTKHANRLASCHAWSAFTSTRFYEVAACDMSATLEVVTDDHLQ